MLHPGRDVSLCSAGGGRKSRERTRKKEKQEREKTTCTRKGERHTIRRKKVDLQSRQQSADGLATRAARTRPTCLDESPLAAVCSRILNHPPRPPPQTPLSLQGVNIRYRVTSSLVSSSVLLLRDDSVEPCSLAQQTASIVGNQNYSSHPVSSNIKLSVGNGSSFVRQYGVDLLLGSASNKHRL